MSDFPLFPEQASTVAWQVDALYGLLMAISLFFIVLVFGLVIVFSLKYRRKSKDEQPKQIHGSIVLELAWTIIPLFMAIGVFTIGADVYFRIERAPADPLEIYVVGKQWMWKAQHESGKREINTLHIPVGQPVRLTMTSEDVLHDFFIPAFRVKKDVIPGRYTSMWFEASKVGEYHLFCAEYCGTQHSYMIGTVTVLEQTEYLNWLLGGSTSSESMSQAGEKHFSQLGCSSCHLQGSDGRGPSLYGIYDQPRILNNGNKVVADISYLRESILHPQAKIVSGYEPIMPVFAGQINEQTLGQLIAYIKSLKKDE